MSFFNIFSKNKHTSLLVEKREPLINEEWQIDRTHDDPWPIKKPATVMILDVRDGWVRYDMGWPFSDERMKMSTFLHCYKPYIE